MDSTSSAASSGHDTAGCSSGGSDLQRPAARALRRRLTDMEIVAAIESSRATVKAARCENAADFFSYLSVHGAAAAHQQAFKTIVLMADYSFRSYIVDFVLSFIQDEQYWGIDALMVDLSELDPPDRQRLLRALASIPPFTTLCLALVELESSDDCIALNHALSSSNFTSLLLAGVDLLPDEDARHALRLHSHVCLQSLFIMALSPGSLTAIIEALPFLSSLTSLTLHHLTITPSQVHRLFSSLEDNLHLTSLSLTHPIPASANESWPRTIVLDSLRRNSILHKVDLRGTPLEDDAAIATQLRKNAEYAARVELLKSQGMAPIRPSTIRLYLCGLPLSGKTTLSRSLAKWSKGSISRWTLPCHKFSIRSSERTHGIEVTIVESQMEQVRISIWDMAGHLQYHSFHDSMLPDLNDRATPPLFLYVWNPFKVRASGKVERDARGRKVRMDPDQFRDDFKYWLKFIASKTSKSELFKPKVIIVVTRADMGLPDMRQWLHSAFNALQKQFEEYICFDKEGFFQVDARNPNNMWSLATHLFRCTKTILSKAPDDFILCVKARELFENLRHSREIPPLITKERFYILSQKHLGIESQETCEVVALSLNSTGDLIYFPFLELVVLDTQWFCQKIMGDLIHFKTDFFHSEQGFFPLQLLQSFFEQELSSRPVRKWDTSVCSRLKMIKVGRASIKISGHAIVKLLMGLRLACPRDYSEEDSDIFIPASLCGKARGRIVPSKYLKLDGSCTLYSYIGRRWAVKGSNCTFLTPGIFPLLQVTFHNNLSTREIHVDLDQDVMAFAFEGARVFVEFCRLEGRDNFIDVLVVSLRTLDEALEWLHENVTIEMKKVFADSRGIPGVELVQSVIQPASIQGLMEARQRKAVPIQVLQDSLMRHVQSKGIKFTGDGIGDVIYTWQTEPLADDSVVSLLGEAAVAKLVELYRASLSEAASHVLPFSGVAGEEGSIRERERPDFGSSQSDRQREAIYDKLCDVEVLTRGGFDRLAHQVEDLRRAVLPKLHEMFTFFKEGEAGKVPRMCIVTQDDGTVRRLVSKLVPGLHNLRLELLCECHNLPCHRVEGQHGLSIATLDDGLLKAGLPYIDGFLRIVQLVTKIGAHLAIGYSDIIPDFTRVLAGIVDAQAYGPLPTLSGLTHASISSSRMDFQKGEQWLFDVLSHHNCTRGDQIYKQFGLRRIRYTNSTVAWVCDRHYSGGAPFPA